MKELSESLNGFHPVVQIALIGAFCFGIWLLYKLIRAILVGDE